MKHELTQSVVTVAQNPKTQAGLSTVLTAAGVGAFLNYVPGIMSLVAMGIGVSLQLVLRRKGRLESEKLQLEINILKRKEEGLPTRRDDDQLSK